MTIDLTIELQARNIWERAVLVCWEHADHPKGRRFLGSAKLKQADADKIIAAVGRSLAGLQHITYEQIQMRLFTLRQSWLKLYTYALSEFAYYYSDFSGEGFWSGFCKRLGIKHSQGIENTLRQLGDEGADLLGLVRATGGYRCVSTFWLQSGIPARNLEHFAQLIREISDLYGWWDLAHAPAEDIAQELLDLCREHHEGRKTLLRFLESSCDDTGPNEPISGQLVKGLALVASELERQSLPAEALADDNRRSALLAGYYLPPSFFIRNWQAIVHLLTPKPHARSGSRNLINRGRKPATLLLDVADGTYNTQLVLPEQTLCQADWKDLGGTYCYIRESGTGHQLWEGIMPATAGSELPRLTIQALPLTLEEAKESWQLQLLSHRQEVLLEWKVSGISREMPCLLFDAISGERLFAQDELIGHQELIVYTSAQTQIICDRDIEVLDAFVPSSLRGWRGQHIRLSGSSAVLKLNQEERVYQIAWRKTTQQHPSLRGMARQGKPGIFLEAPTLWFPPQARSSTLQLAIADLTRRQERVTPVSLPIRTDWHPVPLEASLTLPGRYEVRLWNADQQYSYTFELQPPTQFIQPPALSTPSLVSSGQAMTEKMNLQGFWPLEPVLFSVKTDNEETAQIVQADLVGRIALSAASLTTSGYVAETFEVDYRRQGFDAVRLLASERSSGPSWTWTREALHLTGLKPDELYTLRCWNLLAPNFDSHKLPVVVLPGSEDTATVPLSVGEGIWCFELLEAGRSLQILGWWGSGEPDSLAGLCGENELNAAYLHTLLDEEPPERLRTAFAALDCDLSLKYLEASIGVFERAEPVLPAWLKSERLLKWLREIKETLVKQQQVHFEPEPPVPPVPPKRREKPGPTAATCQDEWYLLTLRAGNNVKKLFCHSLKTLIREQKSVVLEFREPREEYPDSYLVRVPAGKRSTLDTQLKELRLGVTLAPRPISSVDAERMLQGVSNAKRR